MASPSGDPQDNAADIKDAYEYHVMLQTLADDPDHKYPEDPADDSEEYDADSEEGDGNEDDGEYNEDEPGEEATNAEELAEKIEKANNNDSLKGEDSEEDEPPKFPLFLLTSKTELTLPAFKRNMPNWKDCPNSKVRADMWLNVPGLDLDARGLSFLDQIGQLCIQAKIRECTNRKCVESRERMENAAPECDWEPFRRWALVAMSCQACLTIQQKLTRAHTHIVSAVYECCTILQKSKSESSISFRPSFDGPSLADGSEPTPVNRASVCNVISWMMLIQDEIVIRPDSLDDWDRKFLPSTLTLPVIEEAAQKIRDLGICRNRLWNLVGLSERQDSDLPGFIKTIMPHKESFKAFHGDHDFCTPTKCQRAQIDSTTVAQMHKCPEPGTCVQRTFNVDLLETSLETGKGTAWSTIGPYLCRPNEPYIAISHVWSDGTGVGIKNAGCVNKCLFNYFAKVAETLDCTGIWWDALSIPQESKARSKALNKMHANYANAATTVVHDNYLVNFEWRDDGSPCLALVLSPWFTRGWTALELIMSKNVKVLFKDPKGGTMPLIKDLDKEVLAQEPGASSRTHWLVSGFIQRLRKPIDELSDLLAILKGRSTSWARDRTIIAALLLSLPDCDYTRVEGEITRDILRHIGYVPFECLFHGGVTMADSGPWSWCPATLDDMRMDLSKKMRGINKDCQMVVINKKGAVTGQWAYRELTRMDELTPVGENLAVRVKIKTALRHWKKCLLLREYTDYPGPMLLVTTIGVTRDGLLECRYIGTVTQKGSKNSGAGNSTEDGNDNDSDSGESGNEDNNNDDDNDGCNEIEGEFDAEDIWSYEQIRIGNDEGKGRTEIRASLALGRMLKVQDPERNPNYSYDDSDRENSETESLYEPETLSNYEQSSDEEAPEYTIDFYLLKEAAENTTNNAPWFLRWSATEYRRFDNDMPFEYDMSSFESTETKVEHLFSAVKANKKNVMRHLLKTSTDFPAERKRHLADELGPLNESTFTKLKSLGEVYLEIDQLEDAQLMHTLVIDGLRKMKKRGATETLEAMYTLGKIHVRQNHSEEAKHVFQQVLKMCKEKDKKREKRNNAKNAKALEAKAASKGPSSKTPTTGRRPSRVLPASKGNPTPHTNPSSKENKPNEPKPDQKVPKWYKVEFNTISDLCLLYADENDPTEASKVYRRALKEYGKAPTNVNAFESSWGSEEDDIGSESKKKQYEEAEETYVYALKRLEGEKQVGKKHPLTLITVLNVAIVYEFFEKYQEAEQLYRRAWGGFEVAVGPDHIMTLSSIRRLAIVSTHLGKLQSAGPLYQDVLKGVQHRYGADAKYTLTAISDFGNYYLDQRNSIEAERMFQRVLDGYESGRHQHRDLYFVALRDTARSCMQQGKLEEAEKKFRAALNGLFEIYKRTLVVCSTAFSLGLLYEELDNLSAAEDMFRYSLDGYQRLDEREALKVAGKLGSIQVARGNVTDAETNFRCAYEGYSKTLGNFYTPTLEAAKNLGAICISAGKLDEAETLGSLALTGLVKALGPDDRSTLEASRSLGRLYIKQLKFDLSKKYFTDALKGFEETLGVDHEVTLHTVVELGDTCRAMGNYEEAERLYQRAIDGFPRSRGASKKATQNELDMLNAVLRLGDLYSEQEIIDGARQNIERALSGFNNILGGQDPQTLQATLSLGNLKDQSPDQAEKLIQGALDGFDKAVGPDDTRTLEASASLGYLYMDDPGRLVQAKELIKRAMDGYIKKLVPDHPLTLEAMHRLGIVYIGLGWAPEGEQLLRDAIKGFSRRFGPNHAWALRTVMRLVFPTTGTAKPVTDNQPQAQNPRATTRSVLGTPPLVVLGRTELPIHSKPRPTMPEKDSGFDETYTLPSGFLPRPSTPSKNIPSTSSNRSKSSEKASASFTPSRNTTRSPLPQTQSRNIQASSSINSGYSDNTHGSRSYTATPPPPENYLQELQSHQLLLDQTSQARLSKEMPKWNPSDGICSGCGTKFRRSGAFDEHVSECPRNLLAPKALQFNLTPEWNSRDGLCSGCGVKFRRSGAFNEHVSTCPKVFLAPPTPQWNSRDGLCSGCGTKFRRAGAFDDHVNDCPRTLLLEHQKEDEIKCPTCQAVMWSLDELQKHTNENHAFDYWNQGQATYSTPTASSNSKKDPKCRRCHMQFGSRNALFEHLAETGHGD